ncbi:ABC transporter ATP-binding protein [Paenibacillaceae bacterium]|nr:ABC transporter ATP-binding protein [Paenibacillaceae bacterium]
MNGAIPLHMKQLTKELNGFRLGPVDLMLEQGLTYALIGSNGSGKSTLMRCCMNLLKPTSGTVELFGESYEQAEASIKTRIAFSPEPLEGCELFTLHEMEIFIAPWYPSWDHRDFLRRAGLFRLSLKKRYGQLSQGERKKAALTLALSTQAPLLLLDEPTNGLDIASRSHLKHMLVEDAERIERTVLLATHSIEDIRQFADCLLLLRDGKIEGPYEKDTLIESWRRVWLSGEGLPDLQDIPGVIERIASPIPQLVSCNWGETLAFLQAENIEIVRDRPLSLDEIMERLTNNDETR